MNHISQQNEIYINVTFLQVREEEIEMGQAGGILVLSLMQRHCAPQLYSSFIARLNRFCASSGKGESL
jgi:hypothetical protein